MLTLAPLTRGYNIFTMKTHVFAILLAVAVAGCSNSGGRTTMLFPDCTQVSADQQAQSRCMYRPEPVDRPDRGDRGGRGGRM